MASVPAAFQAKAEKRQPLASRSMTRVSIRRPPTLNSFHNRVPTGKAHSAPEASMAVPGGR